jgi:hypothetical protein
MKTFFRIFLVVLASFIFGVAIAALVSSSARAEWIVPPAPARPIPALAHKLRPELVRASNLVWGPVGPIPMFAAQIHQESAWNPNARSAYANGLTQFTPGTERDIQRRYAAELGPGGAFHPIWAIRALVRYDFDLAKSLGGATPCDRMLFALSGYNGGAGWVTRDRALAAKSGRDPLAYAAVAPFNAGRAPQFFKENRDYPVRIVYVLQWTYLTWGPPVCLS